ncbi:MAG: hypothetical protein J6L64_04090 [Opitutales bacterium]|nr:hypothetical protein [Opitutales bacterium]
MTIRRVAGTWAIEYNGANRPIRFRKEETDTTVNCGYDSQGRRYFKKVTVAECMKIGDQTTDHTKAKKDCLTKAFIFYIAISQLGKSFFESSQDEHCKWIPCRQ